VGSAGGEGGTFVSCLLIDSRVDQFWLSRCLSQP